MDVSPILALAGLAAIGLLATRLPRVPWRPVTGLDVVRDAGGPLVLLGLVLGPGIDLINRPLIDALAPATALAIGWAGATLGARFEWRHVRRIGRDTWLLAAISAATVFTVVALSAWLLGRLVPALSAAWTPRLPTVLTLAAVATASGPGAVALVVRAVGSGHRATRTFSLAAALETAGGALACTVPLALHGPYRLAGSVELGWLAWLTLAIGGGTLVGMVFLVLTRLRPERADLSFALLATLLFGAGVGYATDLSPFVVCGLATGLIVNASRRRHAVRRVLADWEPLTYAILLVVTGALLTFPTPWLLVAVPLLAAVRAAAKWAVGRYESRALHVVGHPPNIGLATIAQGGAAIALGLNVFMLYGGQGAGGALLTTIVLGVATAQLAAPPLMALALRTSAAAPAGRSATPAPPPPELRANAPAESPR